MANMTMSWVEANNAVSAAVRATLDETVNDAMGDAHSAIDDKAIEWSDNAESAAHTAGTLVVDLAIELGQWTLKGLGRADHCGDQKDASEEDVIGRAVDHASLVIYGAVYTAALMACETY